MFITWEQREFCSLAKRITEMATAATWPRVEYEDIVSGQGILNKDIYKKKSDKAGILFAEGDVLFGKLRPYLKNWLFPTFSGIAVGDFWVLRANNTDGQYVYTLLQTGAFQDVANQSVGTKMPRADWSLVSKQRFFVPNMVAEQHKIGLIFKHIDDLITLHQCKYSIKKEEKMNKNQIDKQALLANAWEQRKLGEIVERVTRKNINNESSLPLTISATYGLVDQISYFNNRVASRDVSNYYLVYNGEFAYNKSTSDGYPFGAIKRLDLYKKGVLSTLYIVFSIKNDDKIDSNYLAKYFDTDCWHKGVSERAAEGARNHGLLNISAEDFFDIVLSLPPTRAEQKKIGATLTQLDNLITLHQRGLIKIQGDKKWQKKKFQKNYSAIISNAGYEFTRRER